MIGILAYEPQGTVPYDCFLNKEKSKGMFEYTYLSLHLQAKSIKYRYCNFVSM